MLFTISFATLFLICVITIALMSTMSTLTPISHHKMDSPYTFAQPEVINGRRTMVERLQSNEVVHYYTATTSDLNTSLMTIKSVFFSFVMHYAIFVQMTTFLWMLNRSLSG